MMNHSEAAMRVNLDTEKLIPINFSGVCTSFKFLEAGNPMGVMG